MKTFFKLAIVGAIIGAIPFAAAWAKDATGDKTETGSKTATGDKTQTGEKTATGGVR